MSVWVILGLLILVGALLSYVLTPSGDSDSVVLIPDLQSGLLATTRSATSLLPSFNQPQGRVYSYTAWMVFKDFTQGYGTRRKIFSRGDAPGLYLDSTSNSLSVAIKTYTTTETILIPNIPAMKWIHFALVVDQNSVDIYINGTLRQHHTLGQLPDLTEDSLTTGPGWDGYVGRLTYYRRALSYAEVTAKAAEEPPKYPEDQVGKSGYFDITWYIGRLTSTA